MLFASTVAAQDPADTSESAASEGSELLPDIREDESKLKYRKRNFVVVPIPMSNPTLDTGLILGAAYFWPQTEQQKAAQPASVTGAAAMYTSNDSKAYGIAQSNYWHEDRWRFEGVLGYADLQLELRAPSTAGTSPRVGWAIQGNFFQGELLRQISGDWYAGVLGRYFSLDQTFDINIPSPDFALTAQTEAVGLGVKTQYDSRDMPFNSYAGRLFEIDALFNSKALGSDNDYQTYKAKYRSYHRLNESVVLAWELQGCTISGKAALWDTCKIPLRGFPATEFLGNASASGQAEGRWQFHLKWGAVAFAGAGYVKDSFSDFLENEPVPSYGIGLRFMVLDSHRINVRLDYARSRDNDAVYLSVGEAF